MRKFSALIGLRSPPHSPLALKATPSFLPGYIKLAEGEKDPRNLLVAFNIAKVIILEFDISFHVDVSSVLSARCLK